MASLKCLHFEDDRTEFSTISQNLKLAWDTVGVDGLLFAKNGDPVGKMEFSHYRDPEKVQQELAENRDKYHLLILDVILEDSEGKQRNVGTGLANYARGLGFSGGIIGISGVEQTPGFRGARLDFEKQATLLVAGQYGTHGYEFIQKADLFETDNPKFFSTDLGRLLRHVLIDAGVLVEKKQPNEGVRVFISHSHEDKDLAKRMVDLLVKAIRVNPDEIRCTSVPGCDLAGGDPSADVLKKNLQDCDVVIGLITSKSLSSSFVLFELGAAWGLGKRLIPFVGPDHDPGIMRAPLRDLHAYRWRTRTDWEKLIDDLARSLGVAKQNQTYYSPTVDDIIKVGMP